MTAETTTQGQTSPLHEILAWSVTRPDWQRDALRRIVEKGYLDDTDIVEMECICRSGFQIDTIKPVPIAACAISSVHLPSAPGAAESVSLLSICDLQHVNRLPHGSTIPFGVDTGLTIIYGANGAGKSSYARVIKKACRARGVPPKITSNAFASTVPTSPATATIRFKAGSTEVPVSWTDGEIVDPRLANVFVFDAFSAEHYVSEDSTAAFTPHGLDVLPTLTKACDELAERLKADIAQWRLGINGASANWQYDPTTEVGKCISKLLATTQEEDIVALAGLDQDQAQHLVTLREALKSDPLQKAKETRAAASRLVLFADRLAKVVVDLSDEKVKEIKRQQGEALAAESAAKAFAAGQFDTSFLAGTGSELWRTLWEAARAYSNSEAYPDKDYPVVEGRCVLCQQEFDGSASKRLSKFDAYCKDTSQQLSAKTVQVLSATLKWLTLLTPLAPELEKVDADLAAFTSEQRLLLSEFIAKADGRLRQLKQNLLLSNWVDPASFSASPESSVRAVITNLETRAKTEESAHDPTIRKELESARRELEAREWLSGVKTDILAQIGRLKAVASLESCAKELKTKAITDKSTELTQRFVTQAFQKRFKAELKKLGLKTLDVALEPIKGKKAETKFGLQLVGGNGKVKDIASEGEKRCIALAAFLAELSQAAHQSALVFDDPVSSLDHWHREKIADRLVAEAAHRQVIVFTHDVVFLNDLLSFAEDNALAPSVIALEWDDGAPGRFVQGLPWDSRKPSECLNELERNQKTINAKWNPQPNAANVEAMRHAYSRLRSTMERIVEVELLDGIVCRFESQVKAGRVKSLIGVTPKECDEAKRLLQKCHDITDAHAPTTAAIPDPADLLQDIVDARQLVTDIQNRKK